MTVRINVWSKAVIDKHPDNEMDLVSRSRSRALDPR